ncbi:MAG: osmotically inducible protein OsmC [Chloroflexi bacterium]|nr:OsmC family protein [Chloroflexota bacterium]MQC26166.1 osmotically inducible protein OsmC [Chloroflexota bacterium]
METVNLNWQDGLTFAGKAESGITLTASNDQDEMGKAQGFKPLELLALGVGACTGMDVVSILQKKRQQVSALEVKVTTERAELHPRVWTEVKVHYTITGKDIDPAAVERAIFLSAEKYCASQNMIKITVEIQHEYKIIEA